MHRDASLEVQEQGVLDAWRAEGSAVLAGVVTGATTGADPGVRPRGVGVRAAVVAEQLNAGVGARSKRNWAA